MPDERLERQLAFLTEIDRLKQVLRQTRITGGARPENSAEHSWHLALCALVLAEHAGPGVDLRRVVGMALVHDLVEIDAGDTFCYDATANLDREERERRAADRLFGLLPAEQGRELRALWEEFEAGETPDARLAVALDRLQPLLLNLHAEGGSWRVHRVRTAQVLERMRPIRPALPALWPFVEEAIARGEAEGWLLGEG